MRQPLRMTFGQRHYIFQVLNLADLGRKKYEVQVLLDGVTTTLIKDQETWRLKKDEYNSDPALINAIGKAIGLGYRL